MASLNKVMLIGRLGRDPETRYSNNNLAICSFSLATSRRYRNSSGEQVEETEWHNIVLFDKRADFAQKYLHKGSQVYIEGRLRTRKWTDKENNTRYTTEILAESIEILESRSSDASRENRDDSSYGGSNYRSGGSQGSNESSKPEQQPQDFDGDDDIPF